MKNDIRDALLSKCIDFFNNIHKSAETDEHFGTPPETILIIFGKDQDNNEWKPVSEREAVFRYSKQSIQEAAIDAVPDETTNGMYVKEASAQIYTNKNGEAFITYRFGKKYERCYRYTVRNINRNILLTQEMLIWVS